MKPDVLVNGLQMPHVMERLEADYTLHKLYEAKDKQAFLKDVGPSIRASRRGGHIYAVAASLIDALSEAGDHQLVWRRRRFDRRGAREEARCDRLQYARRAERRRG